MAIKMQVFKSSDDEKISDGWDISEIVHDIEYTTSILGQPGRLSFTVEKDLGDSGFQIGMGYCVLFWHDDNKVFKGYVFSASVDKTESYKVVAYDQMRYLQFHSNEVITDDMTLEDVFHKIAAEAGIEAGKTRIVGDIDKSIKIKGRVFPDTSYYDMLKYAIDWTNAYATTSTVENFQKIRIGDIVYFGGGQHYSSPNADISVGGNRTAGKAKVTVMKEGAKHEYHLVGEKGGSNVWGWVDKDKVVSTKPMADFLDTFYYIRDNFGILELRETKYCGTYDDDGNRIENHLIIGNESLLTNYNYSVDIDKETFNEFLFMYNPKDKAADGSKTNRQVQGSTLVGAIQAGTPISKTGTKLDQTTVGENTIPKWGKLRKIVVVNDISDKDLLAEYMKINVEHFNQPTRSMKLSALGYDGIFAGDTFHLHLGKLDIDNAVYVLNATHKYDGDLHTMELEVNTTPDIKIFG